MSADLTVVEAMGVLRKCLGVNAVEINMLNNKFVEKIISDRPEKEFDVRIPESRLDETIRGDEELRRLSYRTLFHKIFIENIDEYFPFKEMKLTQIGIPLFDVIQVTTDKGLFYVELTGDAGHYGL